MPVRCLFWDELGIIQLLFPWGPLISLRLGQRKCLKIVFQVWKVALCHCWEGGEMVVRLFEHAFQQPLCCCLNGFSSVILTVPDLRVYTRSPQYSTEQRDYIKY